MKDGDQREGEAENGTSGFSLNDGEKNDGEQREGKSENWWSVFGWHPQKTIDGALLIERVNN